MAISRYNISQRDTKEWQIRRAGASKSLKVFKTQKEAVDYGRTLATNQNATVVLHKANGSQETLRKMKAA